MEYFPVYFAGLVRAALILLVIWTTAISNARAEPSKSKDIAEGAIRDLYAGRANIKFLELEWSREVVANNREPKLTGASYRWRGWYDFKAGRMRVDVKSNVPSDADLSRTSRFAFANNRYLIVDSDDVLGWELNDYGPEYLRSRRHPTLTRLSTDPRLLGVFPGTFALLPNYQFDDLLGIFHSSKDYSTSVELSNGHPIKLVSYLKYNNADCTIQYWLDDRQGRMPVKITTNAETAQGVLASELVAEWRSFEDKSGRTAVTWLPAAITVQRSIDGKLETSEKYILHEAKIGEPPRSDLFTWQGMNLPHGFVVKQVSGDVQANVQWNVDKQAFEKWEPRQLTLESRQVPSRNGSGWLLWVLVSAGAGLLLLWFGLTNKW